MFTANTGVGCFVVNGTSEGSKLVTKFGNCTTSDDRATFYRYEKVADEGAEPERQSLITRLSLLHPWQMRSDLG